MQLPESVEEGELTETRSKAASLNTHCFRGSRVCPAADLCCDSPSFSQLLRESKSSLVKKVVACGS